MAAILLMLQSSEIHRCVEAGMSGDMCRVVHRDVGLAVGTGFLVAFLCATPEMLPERRRRQLGEMLGKLTGRHPDAFPDDLSAEEVKRLERGSRLVVPPAITFTLGFAAWWGEAVPGWSVAFGVIGAVGAVGLAGAFVYGRVGR